ncbi:hypothetical protein TRICI_005312 [Trichomonascus ciferrii]|uniref:FAD/NAD(P)-binding domain-containing protein n=1 Tax=Trichomonascus ciferrii TaxID=44093 RepID=A0A642UTR2_9ASCO|nr:hypothetical protein TRICI_005312 [Trichomonascus ciferrii]
MTPRIRKIAVIGGGPSGLTMLKALRGEQAFDTIKCFERGSQTGGLWNYSEEASRATIPSTDPHRAPLGWESAMYKYLDGNIVRETQTWNEFPLDDKEAPLFMDRSQILNYVKEYGRSVEPMITFNTEVTKLGSRKEGGWDLEYKNLETGYRGKEEFDAVAVTTGNYNLPYVPDYPGLTEFDKEHPDVIIHSKTYRKPEDYSCKKLLIVGGSVSAYDLANQIGDFAAEMHQSIRSGEPSDILRHKKTVFHSELSRFNHENCGVTFKDGSRIVNLDAIIFATGYLKSYPFLDETINKSENPIITDGRRLRNIYKHIFYRPDPSLVFLATPRFIAPFQVAEAQAAYVAKIWSNRRNLPAKNEQKMWELARVKSHGNGTGFDSLPYPENVDYTKFLEDEVNQAIQAPNSTKPKHIDDRVYAIRRNTAPLKIASNKYFHKHGVKPRRIQQLIDDGLFEWE